jgi:hypothetical protein
VTPSVIARVATLPAPIVGAGVAVVTTSVNAVAALTTPVIFAGGMAEILEWEMELAPRWGFRLRERWDFDASRRWNGRLGD